MKQYAIGWKNVESGFKGRGPILMKEVPDEKLGVKKVPKTFEEAEEMAVMANKTFKRGNHWVVEVEK